MAKTVSIDEIRKRKKSSGCQPLPGQNPFRRSSPDAYVILLDEADESVSLPQECTRSSTNKGRTNRKRPKNDPKSSRLDKKL
jgi:hypothetical protein